MSGPIVVPSWADPFVRAGSARIGGPMGRLAAIGISWWTPMRVLLTMTTFAYAAGYLLDQPCASNGWASPDRYEHLCYSDIPVLYSLRGFADGNVPYVQAASDGTYLEYPVLTGLLMWIAALITKIATAVFAGVNEAVAYFDVNVLLLLACLLVTVAATALTVRRRPWDAALVALAPIVILGATVNWDLLPLAFAGVSLLLWSRSKAFGSGIFLGLAIAAKFYPLFFLGAFAVLALRSGKWSAFGRLLGGTAIAWLVVNLPFIVANPTGWFTFYSFSRERGEDFGSPWYAITRLGLAGISPEALNVVATGAFLGLCAAIGILALRAQRRPRLAQLLFLIVAAFVLTNKVYSPQYALWLVPLAAMARPRWRDFLIWQAGEVIYFLGIWWYLAGFGVEGAKGLTPQWYAVATFIHMAATIYFAVMVIRDILNPEHDVIRTDGFADDRDDPGGGPFNDAPDRFTLRGSRARAPRQTARW